MKLTPVQLLAYERFLYEAKIGYIRLNIPTACPPRTDCPGQPGILSEVLSLSISVSLSVMAAMRGEDEKYAIMRD